MAGGDPGRALMVGDSRTDIDTAKAAGIPVVAVDFGYTDRHVREFEPSRVISHFDELTLDLAERLIAVGTERDGAAGSCIRLRRTPVIALTSQAGLPYIAACSGLRATSGRLAQRESTPFTRVGSQVQSLHRPP